MLYVLLFLLVLKVEVVIMLGILEKYLFIVCVLIGML